MTFWIILILSPIWLYIVARLVTYGIVRSLGSRKPKTEGDK